MLPITAYFCLKKLPHFFFRIRSFLSYLWHGQSRYHVHSDFVYQFINQVLRDKTTVPIWKSIEAARRELAQDGSPVPLPPLGARPSIQTHTSTASSRVKQTAISPLYGKLLYRSAAYFKASKILELGSGTGISTLYLGTPGTVKQLITLEGNPALAAITEKQMKRLNLPHVEVIAGEFDSTLSTALGKLGNVDFVFIDGDHRKEPTIKYYQQILPHTHNDSVVVFDDINWSPEMQAAWQEIISGPEVTLSLSFYRMGMVFFRKEIRQPQHLQLYYW